ncbi:MAG: PilZ domain-containing protein [Desulfobacterales bacterium]
MPNHHNGVKKYSSCGDVRDIGSGGMFLNTRDFIPVTTNLGITICFDSEVEKQNLSISAQGQVVRSEKNGVGIRFTNINLNRFRNCVIEKINKTRAYDLQTIELDELAV